MTAETTRTRPVRPRLAASLAVMRGYGAEREVLIGRRHKDMKFLPGIHVFPGGRVERDDMLFNPPHSIAPTLIARLGPDVRRLALAAIRETYEETGIVVGYPAPDDTYAPGKWNAFTKLGYTPALDRIVCLARGITPPSRPTRYNTYIFGIDVTDLPAARMPIAPPSNELEEIAWVKPKQALEMGVVVVTRQILEELANPDVGPGDLLNRPIPYYRTAGGKFRVAYL